MPFGPFSKSCSKKPAIIEKSTQLLSTASSLRSIQTAIAEITTDKKPPKDIHASFHKIYVYSVIINVEFPA